MKLFAVSSVLTKKAGWGDVTLTHAVSVETASSKAEAEGLHIALVMKTNPGSPLISVQSMEVPAA